MTQFRPGRSGNPHGRPKGARNVSTQLLAEVHAPAANGQPLTKLQAAIRAHVEKAVSGDIRAVRDVLERIKKAEAARSAERGPPFTDSDRETVAEIHRRLGDPSAAPTAGSAADGAAP